MKEEKTIEKWKENKIKYNREYTKSTYKRFSFLVRLDDLNKIEHLENKKSVSQYINELIDKDLKKNLKSLTAKIRR